MIDKQPTRAKALGVGARGRSGDMASLGAWELKATGYCETEDRDGLCVSICTAIGSPISIVYLRIKSYGQ